MISNFLALQLSDLNKLINYENIWWS